MQKSSLSSFCMYVKQRREKEPKRVFWLFFRSAAAPRWPLPLLLPWLFLGLITVLGALSALPSFQLAGSFFVCVAGGAVRDIQDWMDGYFGEKVKTYVLK